MERLINSLDDQLEFVKSVINDFDSGNISKLYPHLSDEDRKKVLENKKEVKSIAENLSTVLSNGGIYDLDNNKMVELKERINKLKEK